MTSFLYSLFVLAAAPFVALRHALRDGPARTSEGWRERLTISGPRARAPGRRLWLHAASLGELEAARVVLQALRTRPDPPSCLLTTTAPEARRIAMRESLADEVCLAPLDVPFLVRRFLRRARPDALALIETELWPAMILETFRSGRPVLLLNGRLSALSHSRWRRAGPCARGLLSRFTVILARSREDRARFVSLGAAPERVLQAGNLKLVQALRRKRPGRPEILSRLGLDPARGPICIAGSTWPGEEDLLGRALAPLRAPWPGFLLLLAPRRVSRASEVAQLLTRQGWRVALRTRIPPGARPEALVVDTLGELAELYAAADVAFAGGSLVPRGGQNPLEPAVCGVPALFGPHMDNFSEEAEGLLKAGGGFSVTPDNLGTRFETLLRDEPARREAGRAARAFVESHAGDLEETIHALDLALRP